MEDDSAVIGLEKLYNLVSSWSTFMNDLYFICGQTSKNLGSFWSLKKENFINGRKNWEKKNNEKDKSKAEP